MSSRDIDYLSIEVAPVMRAVAVEDQSDMQWEIDIITLSNSRRWGNQELFTAKRDSCMEKVSELPLTLGKVKREEEAIRKCLDPTFWDGATEEDLDDIIARLGPLMRHRDPAKAAFQTLDVKDNIYIRTWLEIDGKPMKKSTYKELVEQFISGLVSQSNAVRKVRDGEQITDSDLQEISQIFEENEHPHSVDNLRDAWGAKRVKLEEFLAHILRGEDLPDWETKVREGFDVFIQEHSTFNARQIEMLNALCNYVIDNEAVAKPALVAAPFTQFDRRGFPGVFETDQINEILSFTEALTA